MSTLLRISSAATMYCSPPPPPGFRITGVTEQSFETLHFTPHYTLFFSQSTGEMFALHIISHLLCVGSLQITEHHALKGDSAATDATPFDVRRRNSTACAFKKLPTSDDKQCRPLLG